MQLPTYLSVKLVLLSNLCWTWASGLFGRAIKAYQIYNAFSVDDWKGSKFWFYMQLPVYLSVKLVLLSNLC